MSEFARAVKLDTLGAAPRLMTIAADADERAALAARFGLLALDRLTAEASLRREGDAVFAEGEMRAEVVQACVATGAPLPATLAEPFALRFVPEMDDTETERELDATELDTLPYMGGAIELGEAVAETLGLALDPFPRSPDADVALKAAGVVGEEDVGPFAALKGLRDRLRE